MYNNHANRDKQEMGLINRNSNGSGSTAGLKQFILYQIIQTNPLTNNGVTNGNNGRKVVDLSGMTTNNPLQLRLQTILLLVNQIIEKKPHLLKSIENFYKSVQKGEPFNSLKLKIFVDNNWLSILHDPLFDQTMIDNFLNYFNPFITYIGKYHFFKNLHNIPQVLMNVIRFIGYQLTFNQDKQLRNFLKDLCLMEFKKCLFKTNLTNLTSLLIFSYSEMLQGNLKLSRAYYNQGCLMASSMGIHLEVPKLSSLEQSRRHIIRSMMLTQDIHMIALLDNYIPYFGYLVGVENNLDYRFYLPPTPSWNMLDVIDAQANCVLKHTFDKFWLPTMHMIVTYSFKTAKSQLELNELEAEIIKFTQLFDICYLKSMSIFLKLGEVHNFPEAHRVIENYIMVFQLAYHHYILTLNSQYPAPDRVSPTILPPRWLKRSLHSAKVIFNGAKKSPKNFLIMHHHYLTLISMFYLKFSSSLSEKYRAEFHSILEQIYAMFLNYRSKYIFSDATTEAFMIISESLGYQFKPSSQLSPPAQ
jgi:hypothetical protein